MSQFYGCAYNVPDVEYSHTEWFYRIGDSGDWTFFARRNNPSIDTNSDMPTPSQNFADTRSRDQAVTLIAGDDVAMRFRGYIVYNDGRKSNAVNVTSFPLI